MAFACKGRGICPWCMGRRMCQTAANLVEHVLPPVPLRQWVYQLRGRLAFDGKLLGAVTRLFVDSILGRYHRRLRTSTRERAQSGAVVAGVIVHGAEQRASSDLKLNPHLHAVFLDGVRGRLGRQSGNDVRVENDLSHRKVRRRPLLCRRSRREPPQWRCESRFRLAVASAQRFSLSALACVFRCIVITQNAASCTGLRDHDDAVCLITMAGISTRCLPKKKFSLPRPRGVRGNARRADVGRALPELWWRLDALVAGNEGVSSRRRRRNQGSPPGRGSSLQARGIAPASAPTSRFSQTRTDSSRASR